MQTAADDFSFIKGKGVFSHYVWDKSDRAFHKENVKPGGCSVMVWDCLAASGLLVRFAIIDEIMSSVPYWKILKENVQPLVPTLKLKLTRVMQQDSALKQAASPPLHG